MSKCWLRKTIVLWWNSFYSDRGGEMKVDGAAQLISYDSFDYLGFLDKFTCEGSLKNGIGQFSIFSPVVQPLSVLHTYTGVFNRLIRALLRLKLGGATLEITWGPQTQQTIKTDKGVSGQTKLTGECSRFQSRTASTCPNSPEQSSNWQNKWGQASTSKERKRAVLGCFWCEIQMYKTIC